MAPRLAVVVAFAGAAILHLHNAWVGPPLSGFDGPYHAGNVAIIRFEHRLPIPHESFVSFHPPLYYAACALVWEIVPDAWSPRAALFSIRLLNVAAALLLGVAVYGSARRLLPGRPWLAWSSTTTALFLPMLVGPAFQLGNEIWTAALSALSVWALLHCLACPGSLRRAALLGLVLGLAALTKFSALVAVAAAGLALLAAARRGDGWRDPAFRSALVAGGVVLLVAGWFYLRNIQLYGTPIAMQLEVTAREMVKQGYGPPRPLADYLSLHPALVLDPAARSAEATRAVWPATFASVWFDLHGSALDVASPWGRGFAWLLFLCGGLLTVSAAAGAWALAAGRLPVAVRGGVAALGLVAALSLLSYVAFTWRVATFSALKGSYLSPGVAAFSLFAGAGLERLGARGRRAARAGLAAYALAVATVFWVGWLAPLPFNPAHAYVLVWEDAPIRRAYDFFVGAPPRAP